MCHRFSLWSPCSVASLKVRANTVLEARKRTAMSQYVCVYERYNHTVAWQKTLCLKNSIMLYPNSFWLPLVCVLQTSIADHYTASRVLFPTSSLHKLEILTIPSLDEVIKQQRSCLGCTSFQCMHGTRSLTLTENTGIWLNGWAYNKQH